MKNEKEYLYVGHYYDTEGNFILKIGTTNDLARRKQEHTRNYRRAKTYTLPRERSFNYDWKLPLSKYNTLRYEDSNRAALAAANIGKFIRNDRFVCKQRPIKITLKIRKVYTITFKDDELSS